MPHRHHVAAPDKEVSLAECDSLLDDLRSARNNEKGISILLDLGMLMRLAGIFDRQVVKTELALDAG
jgi:hypothetical protein